ncbi:unnamed protein product [Closterium sp. NIES-54]
MIGVLYLVTCTAHTPNQPQTRRPGNLLVNQLLLVPVDHPGRRPPPVDYTKSIAHQVDQPQLDHTTGWPTPGRPAQLSADHAKSASPRRRHQVDALHRLTSQVDLPKLVPLQWPSCRSTSPVDQLAHCWGAASGGAEPGGAKYEGAESGGAAPGGAEPGGAEPAGVEPGGAEPEGVQPRGAESEGAESGGGEPRGSASFGGHAGASPRLSPRPEPLSPQQLREWFAQRTRLRSGAAGAGDPAAGDTGAGGVGATRLGGAGVIAGAGGTEGAAASGLGGARTKGTGATGTGSVGGAGVVGAGARDPVESGDARAGGDGGGGTGADTGAVEAGAGGTGAGGAGAGGARAGDTGAIDPGAGGNGAGGAVSGSTEHREPGSRPASPIRAVRIGRRVPRLRPPPVPGTHALALRPSSVPLRVPLPAPPESALPAVPDPQCDRARAARPTVSRLLATIVIDPSFESTVASALVAEPVDFATACRLDYATALIAESGSASPPSVGGECAPGTDVLKKRKEDLECLEAAVPHLVSMLLAPEGDPDAPDILTPRSYAEAITVPPSGANIVDGMWIFKVKLPPSSPPAFKVGYVARGFSQRQGVDYFQTFSPTPKMTTLRVLLHVVAQRDYELHSLDFSTAFLQGSLHEEIWLRRPPGFTGSFLAGTQWSLRRPVYGLHHAPREWHTLRTTLAALGFSPSTAEPSLFLRTDTSLSPFYVLVYVDDLVFATVDIEALTLVMSELQKRHTCTDLGELRSYLGLQITQDRARHTITLTQSHMVHQVLQGFGFQFSSPQPTPLRTGLSLSAPPSNESVEPSGPYPELVGFLMYLMTCTRLDLAYPLSLLAHYVAPGMHQKVHCVTCAVHRAWGSYSEDEVPVVLTGHADTS